MKLVFSPHGETVADAKVLDWVLFRGNNDGTYYVANALVVDAARLLFLEKKIPKFELYLADEFGLENLVVTDDGRLEHWPRELRWWDTIISKICALRFKT